jgi:iron complex outermembrane recepter protein
VLMKARRDLPGIGGLAIAGLDLDLSPGGRVERRIQVVRDGPVFRDYTEGDRIYDYDVTFRPAAPYVHVEAEPVARLRLSGGLRADFISYDYVNHLDVVQTGLHRRPADARPSYAAVSPKLGATYRLTDEASLFAAYRRGFRAPAEGQLFRQGSAASTLDLIPVKSDSYEVGARGGLGARVRWDVAAYRMRKFDDILGFQLPDGRTETVNAGETLHQGVELGLGISLPAGLALDAAWSEARHTYERWSPREGLDYSGNEQESAPRQIAHAELAWTPPMLPGARVALTWDRLGAYWMDQQNENRYEGHRLWGARAHADVAERVRVFARATNLTDTRYAERATFNVFRGQELAPGLPRTVYVGLEVK